MNNEPDIGRVFTPIPWAKWLLETGGGYKAWCEGATICDPNYGGGAFVAALCELALRDGISLTEDRMSTIFGCELNVADKPRLIDLIATDYNAAINPDNFTVGDVISPTFDKKFDVLVGNPPWANFSTLPVRFRKAWADSYINNALVANKKDVLLGGSRADIATLIVKKILDRNLHDGGIASFFLPLSIFFNSGANDLFRPYPGGPHGYAVTELWDFADEKVFDGVATRYGAVQFTALPDQQWPVRTNVRKDGDWFQTWSTSSDGQQGFWQRHDCGNNVLSETPYIFASQGQQPRQGLNTCGANSIMHFTPDGDRYRNGVGEIVDLEKELLFPLMSKNDFIGKPMISRLALVPHDRQSGRPLSKAQLLSYPKASSYLLSKRDELEGRKGTMLNGHIKRGLWWALLGVGPYSFAPWKVAWEALGKSAFRPKVFPGDWQGNQAMHAYCPCYSRSDAERLLQALNAPPVEAYLQASAMGGTMNWAQPGRVGKLFILHADQCSLAV